MLCLLTCGCSSLEYGSVKDRTYTSGDGKVQITFPAGEKPEITAGYLESKYTCPDDFEAFYLDPQAGCYLVCCAVVPPERQKAMDLKKLLNSPDGRKSVFAATARIVQQKHRSTLNLRENQADLRTQTVFQIYTKMTDESGKERVGSLLFQLKNRWFWLVYEPAPGSDSSPAALRERLLALKNAITMP